MFPLEVFSWSMGIGTAVGASLNPVIREVPILYALYLVGAFQLFFLAAILHYIRTEPMRGLRRVL
jgi:hypothetical protein